jgi:hypothetical protein
VFAKVDDQAPWREYKRLEEVPDLANGFGSSAEMWIGPGNLTFIRMVEPGEDFDAYTDYCFSSRGKLLQVGYELRTAWGWAFSMGGPVEDGSIRAHAKGFVNTSTGKPIAKPESSDDVRQVLKPTLYMDTKQLPFSNLLSK